jgi:hypothetical protein
LVPRKFSTRVNWLCLVVPWGVFTMEIELEVELPMNAIPEPVAGLGADSPVHDEETHLTVTLKLCPAVTVSGAST